MYSLHVIKDVVVKQFEQSKSSSLHLLQLQNHIYGCFILMEDLAQKTVTLQGTKLAGLNYSFDMNKRFSTIGLRYGFVMDTKVALEECLPEYKPAWIAFFKEIQEKYTIEQVDSVEDTLIAIIQQHVPKEEAYFVKALETGSLPQECVHTILHLLTGEEEDKEDNEEKEEKEEKEEDSKPSSLPLAQTEKPLKKARRLSITRRQKPISNLHKTRLAKTRRAVKV